MIRAPTVWQFDTAVYVYDAMVWTQWLLCLHSVWSKTCGGIVFNGGCYTSPKRVKIK